MRQTGYSQFKRRVEEIMKHTWLIHAGQFGIGFLGWFLLGNLMTILAWAAWLGAPAWTFLVLSYIPCVWLSTIVFAVVWAGKRAGWYSAGIAAAAILSIGMGAVLAWPLHSPTKTLLVAATPAPLDYLVLILSLLSPP